MRSQRILTSGIAHEVRTPHAAIKLELGHIDHPRARKAEADLDDLVRFIGQLTALARLDTFDHSMFEEVDLVVLCAGVAEQLAPWIYENKHSLELSSRAETAIVKGMPALLKDAHRLAISSRMRFAIHSTSRTSPSEWENVVSRSKTDGMSSEQFPATASKTQTVLA